ncbi:ADP-ribosylation family protein [Nannocystis sp. SCPEA4]|uniref:ADP-ribosylation family protein n=1 Tax=Nannocystis sp. SCPEA4 TaxID=2996787 RepID=UPI0022716EEC|nr:ADP-ribosylation family protein [Nannocystis sp. SCPEA4]MCY1054580.1 DUF2228 domain-containing protein [Nannocystis sp. SCPEA4]
MFDGETIAIRGSTGTTYELTRRGSVYACTCPAWHKQRLPPAQRTCKHLRAHLGDDHEEARVGQTRVAAAHARAVRSARLVPREPPELRAAREAAVRDAVARFPAVAERMRSVYGMPLPRHLAYAVGFWHGLTPAERDEAWAYLGCGLFGVTEWFEPDGLSRAPAVDERLHGRFRRDPPEFVTVFSGNSDGSHWGLWYDDPHELPRVIAHNWARDDAETGPCRPTLLASLRGRLAECAGQPDWTHAPRILAWLDRVHELELAAHSDERIGPPLPHTHHCLGGMDPRIDGASIPAEFADPAAQRTRAAAYREDIPLVRTWLAEAERELAAGRPLRALLFGRELHWFDTDTVGAQLGEQFVDLTSRAYRCAGREPLADILLIHHRHRDMPCVDAYRPAIDPPLVLAAGRNDTDELARLLAGESERAACDAALARARSRTAFDLLRPHVAPAAVAERLATLIAELVQLRGYDLEASEHAALVDHLLAGDVAVGPAFAQAVIADLPELALRLADRVDLESRDGQGLLPLHRATQAGAIEVVRRLLARGADPLARDAHDTTAIERASELWQDHRAESHALLALLRPAAPPPAPSTALATGDRVTHAKFGAGVVTAIEGTGDAAKLTIAFADANRTLLARFVRRAE